MRVSYSGIMLPSQGRETGPIPVTRSKKINENKNSRYVAELFFILLSTSD